MVSIVEMNGEVVEERAGSWVVDLSWAVELERAWRERGREGERESQFEGRSDGGERREGKGKRERATTHAFNPPLRRSSRSSHLG